MENYDATVPDDLMKQLHAATERFHTARKHLEEAMANPDFQHQERVDKATEQLRQAERVTEEIEAQIKKNLAEKK